MKHKGLACLAAVAISAFAALPFTGRAEDSAAVFEKTTSKLEQGGITFSYTNGEVAYTMVDKMFDGITALIPEESEGQEIVKFLHGVFDELGLKSVIGEGTSVKKVGEYYRCRNFMYAPKSGRKGLLWDLAGASVASKGPAPELKLTAPESAFALSVKVEPAAAYKYVLKKLAEELDEEEMDGIEQQIDSLKDNGVDVEKLVESISGVTFYCEPFDLQNGKFKEIIDDAQNEDLDEEEMIPRVLEAMPRTALIITTKNDLCWKTLKDAVSEAAPEIVQDDKIVPVEGIAIFQAGNYLIATNEEAAIRKRIAGNGTDLTSNKEFAEMLKLADKDFTNFVWVSKEYFKSIKSSFDQLKSLSDEFEDDKFAGFAALYDLNSALCTVNISADGILTDSITSDLQVALLDSETLPGVVAGLLPYAGPIAKIVAEIVDEMDDDDDDDDDMDMDAAILGARKLVASIALERLKESKVPANTVFFTLGEDDLVYAKWNASEETFDTIPEDTEEEEFPYVFVNSPSAAAKADKPDETVIFFEDPMENSDGIYFVFGDESVKFLEGDFESYSEAAEAAVNSFDISDDIAKKLLKRAAAIDEMLE